MDWRFKAYGGIDPHFHEDSDSNVQTVNSEQYLGFISINLYQLWHREQMMSTMSAVNKMVLHVTRMFM